MSRRGFVDKTSGVVFFWSQKCACTTLFRAIGRTYGITNKEVHFSSLEFPKCQKIIQEAGYKSVVIKRNPIDRIISCYINKFVYRNKPLKTPNDLEKFSYSLLATKNRILGGDSDKNSITFNEFLRTIEWLMTQRKDPNENSINGHWDTQVPPAALDFEYDYVVDTSDLNNSFGAICKKYGLDYEQVHANRTPYRESVEGYFGDRPAFELAGRPVGRGNFRSVFTDRMIRYLYGVDFARFG